MSELKAIDRLHRNPEKFDVIDLYDSIGRDKGYRLGNPEDEADFSALVTEALSSAQSPTMIHGRRVEAMFSYITASLGKSVLIKKEDCGDVFSADLDLKIPDYRVVLNSGEQLLIEVKNCHREKEFKLEKSYIESLERYSKLMHVDLFVAVYWSRWQMWTLVAVGAFDVVGKNMILRFETAMRKNQMARLGDIWVGTKAPLSIRIFPSEKCPVLEEGTVNFAIGDIQLFCCGTPISDEQEKQIAMTLVLYGGWAEAESVQCTAEFPATLEYIEFSYSPVQRSETQGFEIVGAVSTVISRQYGNLTAPKGIVEHLSANVNPEKLGFLIAEGHECKALPLWRFHLSL